MKTGKYKHKLSLSLIILISVFTFLIITFLLTLTLVVGHNNSKEVIQNSIISKTDTANVTTKYIVESFNDIKNINNMDMLTRDKRYFNYESNIIYNELRKICATYPVPIYDMIVATRNFKYIISQTGTYSFDNYIKYTDTDITEEIRNKIVLSSDEKGRINILPIYDSEKNLKTFCFFMYDTKIDLIYTITVPASDLICEIPNLDYYITFRNEPIDNEQIKNDNIITHYNKNKDDIISSLESFIYINEKLNDLFSVKLKRLPISIIYEYNYVKNSGYKIIIINIILVVVIMLISFFLFMEIFKILYSPINNTLKNIDLPNNTSIDEFAIIKDSLLKLNILYDELKESKLNRIKLAKQGYYRDLLFGIPDTDCPLTAEEMDGNYTVAIVEFLFEYNENDSNDIFLNLQKNNVYMYIKSIEEKYNIYCLSTQNNALIIVMKTDDENELKAILNNIIDLEEVELDMYISMSSIKNSVLKINLCYEEAVSIIDYKYQLEPNRILTLSDINTISNTSYDYPLSRENRLIQSIINGKDIAFVIFDKTVEENLAKKLSPEIERNFIYALINTIMRSFQELKTTPIELIEKDIDLSVLLSNWNRNNIYDLLRGYISDIITVLNKNTSTSDEQMYQKMLSFIYDNYNDDIMLTDVAEFCNITAPYCSSIFKKYNLDTYKNFLNKYRVQKACEILNENPSIKIQDLSTMVGFNSANSFIRVFKKFMNTSPKSYIENKI